MGRVENLITAMLGSKRKERSEIHADLLPHSESVTVTIGMCAPLNRYVGACFKVSTKPDCLVHLHIHTNMLYNRIFLELDITILETKSLKIAI